MSQEIKVGDTVVWCNMKTPEYKVLGFTEDLIWVKSLTNPSSPSNIYHKNNFRLLPPKHKRWINLYKCADYIRCGNVSYNVKKDADRSAGSDRIACIEVQFEEGEGL